MVPDKKILFGLTTAKGANWRERVAEITQLNLKEVALLPTGLTPAERQVFYRELEKTPLIEAPYVHLRHDSSETEVDYLVNRFKTKAFSCHADQAGYSLLDKLPKYNSLIFVENFSQEAADKLFTPEKFTEHQVSGICLDLAHLEEARRSSKKHYKRVAVMADKYSIGVTQISGVKTNLAFKLFHKTYVDRSLDSLNDLLYLKQYPPHYFAKLVVLELDNSFLEQLEISKFLETILR